MIFPPAASAVGTATFAYAPMACWSFTFSVKMAYPFGMRPPRRVDGP